MASLLDQFTSLSVQSPTNTTADMSGYISMSNETNQKPIFSKKKMNIQLPQDITHLAICNKHLVLTMANNVIFRMHMGDLTDDGMYPEHHPIRFANKPSNLPSRGENGTVPSRIKD